MNLSEAEMSAILRSIKIALYCSFISLPFALLMGYILARKRFFGKAIVDSIIHLPLVLPPVTTGYLLLLVFGTRGIVGGWLYTVFGIKLVFTFGAAVIASVVVSFPLIVRSIRTAFEMVDTGLEDASRTLGVNGFRTFLFVTVPLALPGIVSGIIVAFARSLGEFGATITFAGNIDGETQTLPLAIYTSMQVPGREDATRFLVLASVLISFIAMATAEIIVNTMRKK